MDRVGQWFLNFSKLRTGFIFIFSSQTGTTFIIFCSRIALHIRAESKPVNPYMKYGDASLWILLLKLLNQAGSLLPNNKLHNYVNEIFHQSLAVLIHPIAKVNKPSAPADFRPISIVPVFSRLVERELVHNYLYESFDDPEIYPLLADQFAFRPTR